MANLSLRQRRALARGINFRTFRAWSSRKTTGLGTRKSLTTALAGVNNDLTFLAKVPGATPTVSIVVSGNNTPLSVSASGSAVTITSATNGSAAATSTAAEVVRAVNANAAASALVWAQLAPGNDGTGTVAALASTPLA